MTNTKQTRHAFTLIELLVVISIIALLIAILLPTLSRVKIQVTRTECLSRVRQLTTASIAFAIDMDGQLPGGEAPRHGQDPNFANPGDFREAYVGYLSNYSAEHGSESFYCPSMDNVVSAETDWPRQLPWGDEYRMGYQYMAQYTDEDGEQASNWAGSLPSPTKLEDDVRSAVFTDWTRGQFGTGWVAIAHPKGASAGILQDTSANLVPQSESNRPDGMNTALLDGSARWYTYDDAASELEVGVNFGFIQSKPSGF